MTQLVVCIVLILLPGIIATIISDKLTTHSKWDSFKFSMYALVLGVFSYVTLQILVYAFNIISKLSLDEVEWHHLDIWKSILDGGKGISAWELCLAFALSVPVALVCSWAINYKLFNKLAKIIGVSNKYGDENLFSYYLNAEEIDWVYVREQGKGLTYQGRVVSFSENESVHEIVLSEVSVYGQGEEELTFLYELPTIYICKPCGRLSIEAIPENMFGDKNE